MQCIELYEWRDDRRVTRDLCTIVGTVQEFYGTSEKVLVERLRSRWATEHHRPG